MNVQGEYDNLKKLINNNPYLLHSATRFTSNSNWLAEAKSSLRILMHHYITDTFRSLEKMNKKDFVDEACNLTPFLCCSVNGFAVSMEYLGKY